MMWNYLYTNHFENLEKASNFLNAYQEVSSVTYNYHKKFPLTFNGYEFINEKAVDVCIKKRGNAFCDVSFEIEIERDNVKNLRAEMYLIIDDEEIFKTNNINIKKKLNDDMINNKTTILVSSKETSFPLPCLLENNIRLGIRILTDFELEIKGYNTTYILYDKETIKELESNLWVAGYNKQIICNGIKSGCLNIVEDMKTRNLIYNIDFIYKAPSHFIYYL